MEEKVTVKQALEATVTILSNISVPVGYTEQIALPVSRAIGNIKACLEAIADQEQKEQGQEEETEE